MRWTAVILVASALAACDLPRDPEGTLEDVRGGTMRVGVIEQWPWATYQEHQARGVEAELVKRFAEEIGAEIEWVPGGESRLLEQLTRFELDLVVGGFVASSPWAKQLGTTIPHSTTFEGGSARKHIFATPPGENGWIHRLDQFLYAHRDEAERLRNQEASR